jgi:hypothetical protein
MWYGGGGAVLYLPVRYNLAAAYYDIMLKNKIDLPSKAIFHYCPYKPYDAGCPLCFKETYFKYKKYTPYKLNLGKLLFKFFKLNLVWFLKCKHRKEFKRLLELENIGTGD